MYFTLTQDADSYCAHVAENKSVSGQTRHATVT